MKGKYISLVCIGFLLISDVLGDNLREKLTSLETKISKISKDSSSDDVQRIIQEAEVVLKKVGSSDMSEDEETEVLELEEDCMFLDVAKQYLKSPNEEDLKALQEWGCCKPHLQPIVDSILSR